METNSAATSGGREPTLRIPPFAVDAGEDVVEHPVEDAEVDALDHAHVVELDVQAVLLHLLELAAAVAGEAEGDQARGDWPNRRR